MILFLGFLLVLNLISATCDLRVSLLNQDPYPAVPGDYVKLVFQVEGVESTECKNVDFELISQYPISFDPGVNPVVQIKGGTFTRDYSSFLMIPYKVRVDSDALEGENPIEIRYSEGSIDLTNHLKQFDLYIENVKVDFEVHIKDYVDETKTLTIEILNIGDNDVEALTVEIPEQPNIEIKGSNRNIVGDLDSNDYTTAEFEAIPSEGEIELIIYYNDEINVRRTTTEKVYFNPTMFEGRNGDSTGLSTSAYILIILVLGIGAFWVYRVRKKRKAKHKKNQH